MLKGGLALHWRRRRRGLGRGWGGGNCDGNGNGNGDDEAKAIRERGGLCTCKVCVDVLGMGKLYYVAS